MNCPRCNNPIPPGATLCPFCGTPVYQQPGFAQQNFGVAPGYQQKSRLVYIILAIFLGGLGIHNFYAGHTTNGVIQLVLGIFFCGTVSWIWAIIDIITVTTDSNGVPMN